VPKDSNAAVSDQGVNDTQTRRITDCPQAQTGSLQSLNHSGSTTGPTHSNTALQTTAPSVCASELLPSAAKEGGNTPGLFMHHGESIPYTTPSKCYFDDFAPTKVPDMGTDEVHVSNSKSTNLLKSAAFPQG
jgi:hypothetical protein